MTHITIGKWQTGRDYERHGSISKPARMEVRYRKYDESIVNAIR